MLLDDRLITVAIHTCEHAVALKNKLEREGIQATLQNINLEHPVVASGMRVRIKESDLARALLVIESETPGDTDIESKTSVREILVPTDFSHYSMEACRIAYDLASHHNAQITLLNTYDTPLRASSTQLTNVLTYDKPTSERASEAAERAVTQMDLFRNALSRKLPDSIARSVTTKVQICQGVPEDVINQYSKDNAPMLIVMGTRGADKKGKDLVGSVTAEVLDTCRRPVLTIPEGFTADDLTTVSVVRYFCNSEQCDILAIQRLHELIGHNFKHITLTRLESKRDGTSLQGLESLSHYCADHFPSTTFSTAVVSVPTESNDDTHDKGIGLIAVPNKRKSAFARIFNPGMAHRLLFKADIPMIVVPV